MLLADIRNTHIHIYDTSKNIVTHLPHQEGINLYQDEKILYISVKEYLKAIVTYYETGDYKLFKKYFISNYRKMIEMIAEIEEMRYKEREFRR